MDIDDLGDADSRIREGLPTDGDEDRLQEWLDHYLNNQSQGKYESLREVMVAFKKRPDLRLVAPPFSPTSIEIKWADDWSFNELSEALSDQLVGRYMRARRSRHGVILLGWRGKKQRWRPNGETGIRLSEVVGRLNDQANDILSERMDIDGLNVLALNLSGGVKDIE